MAQQPPRYRISPEAREILDTGLRNKWYGICPSSRVGDAPVAIKRWNRDLVLWRSRDGQVHLQNDRCPHRGAPLSIARHDGDRLTCVYHGAEILGDGTVADLPGEPGCDLVGQCAVKTYPVQEYRDVIYAWLGDDIGTPVASLALPERLTSDDLIARIKADKRLTTQRERCKRYANLVLRGSRFGEDEYPKLGGSGCDEYPIAAYPWDAE